MAESDFATLLLRLLAARGWQPAELARRSGLPRQTVHKLLAGSAPRWNTVQRIASALGVSTEDLRTLPT